MSRLVKIATVGEVRPQGLRVVAEGEEILLVKDAEGFYALDKICSHQEKELLGGFAEDGAWVCPHHGARFDLKSGAALSMPAVEDLKVHRIRVVGEDIFLEAED